MKAIVCCPGPSLRHADLPPADLAICVNRAAIGRTCDFWACGDPAPIYSAHSRVMGTPVLFTMRSTIQTLVADKFAWPGGMLEWESLFSFLPTAKISWTLYTMLAAIVLAASRGAKEVQIFGCDWTHEPDWDGNADALENREEHRWKLEREIYTRLTDELNRRGVEVKRIQDRN